MMTQLLQSGICLVVWAMDDFRCRRLVEAPSLLIPQVNDVP